MHIAAPPTRWDVDAREALRNKLAPDLRQPRRRPCRRDGPSSDDGGCRPFGPETLRRTAPCPSHCFGHRSNSTLARPALDMRPRTAGTEQHRCRTTPAPAFGPLARSALMTPDTRRQGVVRVLLELPRLDGDADVALRGVPRRLPERRRAGDEDRHLGRALRPIRHLPAGVGMCAERGGPPRSLSIDGAPPRRFGRSLPQQPSSTRAPSYTAPTQANPSIRTGKWQHQACRSGSGGAEGRGWRPPSNDVVIGRHAPARQH